MIYGKGSKGNYPKLASYARKLPIFPDIDNERSMLHIDNLCEFIRLMIENEEKGTFFLKIKNTLRLVRWLNLLQRHMGKKIRLTKLANRFLSLTGKNIV